MSMSEAARGHYQEALKVAALKHGSVVSTTASFYGWQDFDLSDHLRGCSIQAAGYAEEDFWYEFKGTFYEGDTAVHGIAVHGVSCRCGRMADRTVRWSATVSEVAEAVFEEAFGRRAS